MNNAQKLTEHLKIKERKFVMKNIVSDIVVYGGIAGLLIVSIVGCNAVVGIGVFGPTREYDVTIERTYVDFSGSGDSKSSHYMVSTDKGIFEVNNSLLMWIWNADEIYGSLKTGSRYHITTEGKKVLNFLFQEYPYITKVKPLVKLEEKE